MLTTLYRYRVDIGSLSYLVYIVGIAMLTISCRYRVEIVTLSYLVHIVLHRRHRDVNDIVSTSLPCHTSFTSSTSRNQKYTIALLNQRKFFYTILAVNTINVHDVVRRNQKSVRNDVRIIVTSQEQAQKTRRSMQTLMCKPAFSL